MVLRIASQLFGGSVVTTDSKVRDQQPEHQMITAPEQSAAEAAQNLERTLEHFESMLKSLEEQMQSASQPASAPAAAGGGDVQDLKETIRDTFERLDGTLQRLAAQAERLADGASDLAKIAGGVEVRMQEATRAMREVLQQEVVSDTGPANGAEGVLEPPEALPSAPSEPAFEPHGYPLSVDLAAVSGFQQLMEAQRTLDQMDETEGVSVVAFRNGVASLEVWLRDRVTARRIVDVLRALSSDALIIEESRPDANKLRLRFVESGVTA
jgi:small-conductance mechanosensitive channel